jgi:neutral ceramidase
VRCITRDVALPVWRRDPPTEAEKARVEELKRRLAELRGEGAPADEVREANRLARRASMDLWMAEKRSQASLITIPFQAIRLGSTALVGIPVEPFAEIGAQVKQGSRFATTFFSGYTNGVHSYLPTADAYAEGGYEVWMTPFASEAAALTVEASLALLHELQD